MADAVEDEDSPILSSSPHKGGSFSGSQWQEGTLDHKKRVERSNLLNIAKLCIKTLIDASLSIGTGRVLTEECTVLEQFFVISEHVLRHGLKARRSLLGQRKEFYGVLEMLESLVPGLHGILLNIRNLPNIKTTLGKCRAWLRLSLMQKVIAEQMLAIVEEKGILREWYEDYSMVLCEEGSVFAGLLVGLAVIDCNFDLKGSDLDSQNGIIDISLYLRDGNYLERPDGVTRVADELDGQKIEVILDQKAYLEQLNKALSDSVVQLQRKVKVLQEEYVKAMDENQASCNNALQMVAERDRYKADYEKLVAEHVERLKVTEIDINTERQAYQQSRTGLNDLYLKASADLEHEKQLNKEMKILMEEQIAMNREKEVAMQLLERDIHDKQDTLISLRRQLEDIKKINLELHNKWQSCELSLKKQQEDWSSMEQKCARIMLQSKDVEAKLMDTEALRKHTEEAALQMGARLAEVEGLKASLETDLKIEREWRSSMQAELNAEKERVRQYEREMKSLRAADKESAELRSKLQRAEASLAEQESTLFEMGKKLNLSQNQVEEMNEMQAAMKEKIWKDDKDVNNCFQCSKEFSLSRRKHHCRNCGGIFCNTCSDNTMPLPSSAKPVRVCDQCHEKLLSRYSAGAK